MIPDDLPDECPFCESRALETFESVPLDPGGRTGIYLRCSDCGAELAELGSGGVL